jgi:hypothetical protein
MVIEQINIERIAAVEAEDDAPIRGHLDCPKASQFAFKRVEPEAGGVYVGHSRRGVQTAQDTPNLGHLVSPEVPVIALLEETLQAPMPKAPYRHDGM